MRRVRLGVAALEWLAARAGVDLPWTSPPAVEPVDGPADGPGAEPDAELRRIGLLDRTGRSCPELAAAFGVLARPELLVDVDLAVAAPAGGHRRLHSWHRRAGGRVTAVSTAGGVVELAWGGDRDWPAELARAVTLTGPPPCVVGADRPPPTPLELSHELVLGSGAALQRQRPDLALELAARHGADPDVVRRLHTAARGRMRTVVTSPRATGWVSWLRYDDGWRALTPQVRAGIPVVRLEAVVPDRLGVEVAALAVRVAA